MTSYSDVIFEKGKEAVWLRETDWRGCWWAVHGRDGVYKVIVLKLEHRDRRTAQLIGEFGAYFLLR